MLFRSLKDADVLAILTEWQEFKTLNLQKVAQMMRNKNIVDCRNLINANEAKENGFKYMGIGK